MVDISRNTYERNGIETIIDNDRILWLNEKHIKEGLDHKHLREITRKYNSNHRKHRYELIEEPKKKVQQNSCRWKIRNQSMDSRTMSAHEFRTRLRFKQCDVILTKEPSLLTKIMSSFVAENLQTSFKL